MKVLITAGILLVCAYCVTSTALPISKKGERDDYSNEERYDLRDGRNYDRRSLAKHLGIANMNRVSYNSSLESKAMESKCFTKSELKNFTDVLVLKKYNFSEFITLMNGGPKSFVSCLSPLQTEMACARKVCDDEPDDYCICGPEPHFVGGNMMEGRAGTGCRGENDDGLCLVEKAPLVCKKCDKCEEKIVNNVTMAGEDSEEEEDYEDGGSSIFSIRIIVNFTIFYLILSFF